MHKFFWRNLATQGAIGYGQAPGTIATLMTVPVVWYMHLLPLSVASQAMLASFFVLFGCYIVARALPDFKQPDPPAIVMDEMVAFVCLFVGLPVTWYTLMAGFVLFRLFDICKPCGLRSCEQLSGIAGVMCDDLGAALYAHLLIRVGLYLGGC